MLKIISIALFAILISGCETTSVLNPKDLSETDLANSAILIVGSNSSLPSTWGTWSFSDGKIDAIIGSAFLMPTVLAYSKDGYAIIKARPTNDSTRFGIETFRANGGKYFPYCKGRKVPTISIKAGEIVYAGDIKMEHEGNSARVTYDYNFEQAKKSIAIQYPLLADKIQERKFEFYSISSMPTC